MATAPFLFYAAEPSYFSGKVRPALRYKGIRFEEVAPTPQVYRDVIRARTGLTFIPVIVTPDDEVWQDTSEILDALEARFPEPAIYPATPVQRGVAYLVEVYADEFGVLPAMHYRWSFPESEAFARSEFARANGDAEAAQRFADRMKASLPALGVHPESIPAIEAHLLDLLAALEVHFAGHAFLLGSRMSLADCALLGPLYAHLRRDPVPGRLLRETAPRTCAWIERMNHPEPGAGSFLPDDRLAPSLRPVLEVMGRDATPVLLDGVRAFETWADTRPAGQDEPPRAVGLHRTRLRGVSFTRYTSPYTLWMVERPLDFRAGLGVRERSALDAAVAGTGFDELLAFTPRHRLGKRGFKLVFAR